MELSQGRKLQDVEASERTASGGDKELRHNSPSDDDGEEGTRQPYNCTFCKRGFPTAQALGGHMNVHRKDRGRTTPAPPAAASTDYETIVAFTATAGYGQSDHPAPSGSCSSSMVAGAGGSLLIVHAERAPQELRMFGRDQCGGGGRSEPRRECYGKDGVGVGDGDGDDDDVGKEEELDLELRLGRAAS